MHKLDEEYFGSFMAPIMQAFQEKHFMPINHTIPFFGPMLYFVVRALRCRRVLEIGHADGYSMWYLTNAIKDNATRFQYPKGTYGYDGIDIIKSEVFKKAEDNGVFADLPINIVTMDSIDLNQQYYLGKVFDLIFQDGAHDTEHVLHEMKILYPRLRGEGEGYWIMHDTRGPAEEGWHEILKMINAGIYNFEYVCLDDGVYGLTILRKTENEDPEKRHWNG